MMYHRLASSALMRSRVIVRQNWRNSSSYYGGNNNVAKKSTSLALATVSKRAATTATAASATTKKTSWWTDPQLWGVITAVSGWTMSIAAIYDSMQDGPEVISLNMTGVLIVYSSLFLRWAFVVKPQNLLLASCHFANICAQLNQLRRGLQYKLDNGQEKDVKEMAEKAAIVGGAGALVIAAGPHMRKVITNANLGTISDIAKSDAGPFRVHFWAPMSKWLISGASMVDLSRPTENISLPQYLALTSCGILHARYALLVIPTNYMLCSVNLALFVSSAWHLGRKIKADYIDGKQQLEEEGKEEGLEVLVSATDVSIAQEPVVDVVRVPLRRHKTSWAADGVPEDKDAEAVEALLENITEQAEAKKEALLVVEDGRK